MRNRNTKKTIHLGVNAALLVALMTGFSVEAADFTKPETNIGSVVTTSTQQKNISSSNSSKPPYTKEDDSRLIQASPNFSAIQYVIDNKLMSGYTDGMFYPQKNVTREEAAVLFSRLMEPKALKDHKQVYADVLPTRWSSDAIHRVAAAGIMSGYNNGTFKSTNKITRLEFAVAAANYLKTINYVGTASAVESKKDASFTDYVDIPQWAQKKIDMLAHEGFLDSGTGISFRPNDPLTREDAALLLTRLSKANPLTPQR